MGYYHSFVTKVCLSRELSRSNEQAALALAGRSCSLARVAKCAGHVEGHLVSLVKTIEENLVQNALHWDRK